MKHPAPGSRISTDFHERRPLSVPPEKRAHPHGAIDLAAPSGTTICAPEDGEVYLLCAIRGQNEKIAMPQPKEIPFNFHGAGYWYDTFGGVIILVAKERTHLMTHSYMEQLHDRSPGHSWLYQESKEDARWPAMVFYTTGKKVKAGEPIGLIGNAGFSTGPHIHWEIHPGKSWVKHDRREDPASYIGGGK